jgi:diguanylate cyclase (GGDEF)-like protein/PAS domain S-box-containing protein
LFQQLLSFLSSEGFMPHGVCFQWQPIILWLTVISDSLIFLAYFSIPIAIAVFVSKRKDLEHKGLYLLFSLFIVACGVTHLFSVINIWAPLYGVSAVLKGLTALVSVVAAVLLWPLLPILLKIPSPKELQQVNSELVQLNESLDKQVEQRTRQYMQTQQYLQHIISLCPSVIYTLVPTDNPDSPFKISFISEKITEMCGFSPEEWYQNPTLWIDHVHPDDRSQALSNMTILKKKGALKHEYRFACKSGNYCWVRDELTVDYDHEENLCAVYGSWDEITTYKKIEDELRLAATTFESMQAIMITDARGTILRVNKAFSEITGFSPGDVIGLNPRVFKSGHQDEDFYKKFWTNLLSSDHYEGELWNRNKNGDIYPVWQSITAVRDPLKRVTHYVSVFSNIAEKKEKEQEIHSLAYYDALTQLPNRRLLIDRFDHELEVATRHKRFGGLIFLDLDDFKLLNDSAGHLVGDELLIQVANRISGQVRSEDTAARLGGDEFVVLLQPNDSSSNLASKHAMQVAEKIQKALNKNYVLNGTPMHFTPSIGISIYPDADLDAAELIQQADTAMYRSKSRGKNLISFFSQSMQAIADERIIIDSQLRVAVEENQFELYFQPQIYQQGSHIAAEALIRWHHPERELLVSGDFITIAEQSDLIIALDQWVITAACQQVQQWQQEQVAFEHLSINISSRQLKQESLVEWVEHLLQTTGADPKKLMFEVTESIFIDKIEQAVNTLNGLKKLGIRFSLDDFGTGYSSLSYLKSLPLEQVKIDRTFIQDIGSSLNDQAIVETVIAMAAKLNLQVIAEGVETVEQVEWLVQQGCCNFQGYYFSRPLAQKQFVEFVKQFH